MDAVESALTVRFQALGKETRNLVSWSIDSAYLVSTDGFEFEILNPAITKANRLEMQPVELLLNGASQAIGRIDKTRQGGNGPVIACFGRDYLADLVEGNVDPKFKLRQQMTVDDLLTETCGPYGIDTIFDDTDENVLMSRVRAGLIVRQGKGGKRRRSGSKRKKKGRKLQDFAPKPGEGAYEYCNRIVARIGATLQPGPTRACLCVTTPNYEQDSLYRIVRFEDPLQSAANNILEGVADRDFSRMPTYTLFNGTQARKDAQGKPISKTADIFELAAKNPELLRIIEASTISGRWETGKVATEVRDQGKLYRLLNFRDDNARDQDQLERAADRAVAERLKDSLSYQCSVRGHADERTGAIYSVDTMIRVDDDIADLHEDLWIAARTLSYSKRSGPMTKLTCWRPDSFVIDGSLDED